MAGDMKGSHEKGLAVRGDVVCAMAAIDFGWATVTAAMA
jgi:hypothetical protein